MNEALALLVRLQDVDYLIAGKTALVDAIPQRLLTAGQPLRDAMASYERHKLRHEAIEKSKKEKERLLDDMNERIRKAKARASEIKTNKEYQAHLKEIEAAEKELRSAEDETLSLMEAIEVSQKELSEETAKIKAEKDRADAFENKLKEDAAEAENELTELRARRSGFADVIDKDLYNLYVKILDSRKNVAVVEAKGERCLGCNMNIPPQLFVEIKKNEGITQCPQCGRILYWKG